MSASPYPIIRQTRQTAIFLGDGGKVYAGFDFKIFDIADVEVWTLAVGETHFSQATAVIAKVADLPFDDFTVTFAANQLVTTEIVVRSARLDERSAGVLFGSGIDPNALEKEFSKISTILQELRRDSDRAVVADFGQDQLKLDAGLEDGDTLMKMGDRLVKGANAADITLAQGYAEAAGQSADEADAARILSETARDKSQDWAEGAGTPGGPGTLSSKGWSENAATSAAATAWRVFPDVATATAATIPSSATYIAIASYSPVPRFYKRFVADPGSGDRFQSADLAWWQGLPLPGTTFDFANPVLRSGNVTIGTPDFDQVHLWTIPVGTTYTATLPDPDTCIGRAVHLQVDTTSRGILAFSCPDPIGKFTASQLVIWGGESLTLVARAGRWEIEGGVCKPLQLFATNPGADIAATWVANTGWITAQQGGEEWAISAGGIVTPRSGFYTSSFKVGVKWASAPTFVYSVANNTGGQSIHRNQVNTPAGASGVFPSTRDEVLAKGAAITPVVIWSGGTTVVVERTTFGTPELALREMPQW